MTATNTSTVATAVAVMLLRVHWFVADHTPAALLLGQNCTTSTALGTAGCGEHQSPGYRDAEAAILSLIRFTAGLHEVRTSV